MAHPPIGGTRRLVPGYAGRNAGPRGVNPRVCAAGTLWVVLLAIPSPGDPFLVNSGPLHVRWYGVLLAIGVLLAGWVARREMRRRGADPELAYSIAVWTVPLGLIGARLYHVATDWSAFYPGNLQDIPAIWQGGLGIYGAVAGGMLGTWIGCRRVRLPFWLIADCIAPGLILAQALGRWGNYANQELYGRRSDLPWAVRIDNPQAPYPPGSTFQPTFLYESLWDLGVFLILYFALRRRLERAPGTLFLCYLGLYSLGRLWVEGLRTDSLMLGSLRVAQLVSVAAIAVAVIGIPVLLRRRPT